MEMSDDSGVAEALPGAAKMNTGLLVLLVIIGGTWFLTATYIVTMPMAFAFFMAMLVLPVQRALSYRLPSQLRWMALLAAVLMIVFVLAVGGGLIYLSVMLIVGKWPEYSDQAQYYYNALVQYGQQIGLVAQGGTPDWSGASERIVGVFAVFAKNLWSFLATLILIFILAVLMLMEVRDWKRKMRTAFTRPQNLGVVDTVESIAERVRQFMVVRTVTSGLEAVVQGLFLWAVGVDFAFVWALLFFILNFIPYIGSILAVFPPVLMALFQYGPLWALLVFIGLTVIDQVMGNVVGSRIQGRALEISPAVLAVAVLYWGLVWGVAGALLAVPMTATILVACDNVPGLRPLALLLSDTARPTGLKAGNSDEGPPNGDTS